MKAIIIIFIFALSSFFSVSAQTDKVVYRNWNAFYQKVDVTKFRGYNFKLTAMVKADTLAPFSSAHLFVKINKTDGREAYFNNMIRQPIQTNEWKEYSIEGSIDKQAEVFEFGGLYFEQGIYYYDDFKLTIQQASGEWINVDLKNSDFENSDVSAWIQADVVNGFEFKLLDADKEAGNRALVIDGTEYFKFGNNKNGKFTLINGINIYYEEYGKGEPLLLLHGNSNSIGAFENQIPELARYYRVIAVDTRGQGKTSENGGEISYEVFAQDVAGLVEYLKLDSVNVLGWSDGGNTALILAIEHSIPIKKLAIMGANLYNDKTSVSNSVNRKLKNQLKEIEKLDYNGFEAKLIRLLLNEPNIKPEDLKKIDCPVLVMAGSKDIIKEDHTRLIAYNIPHSQLVIFEDGTHFEPWFNPERFNKAVVQFFYQK